MEMSKKTADAIIDTLLKEGRRTVTLQVIDKELAKKFIYSLYDGTVVQGVQIIEWGFDDKVAKLQSEIESMQSAIDELYKNYGSDKQL